MNCIGKSITLTANIIIYILAFIILLSGCGKSADKLYTEGKQLILNVETFENGIQTLQLFEKKHPEDPRAPEVLLALATCYQSRKNFTEAISLFGKLIEKYPHSAEAYKGLFLLGYMYYDDIKDNDKARTTLTTFINTYPDSELTVSAKVLIENIDIPVEEWSIVKNLKLLPEKQSEFDSQVSVSDK